MIIHPGSTSKMLLRGSVLPLEQRVHVMGILNVTPDSFSDGGCYLDPVVACDRALQMQEEGADLLDIGAESSRPGAESISEEEEVKRLLPVLKQVCRRVHLPVSVDTTKARVAQLALDAGAVIINDISAMRFDPAMRRVMAESGAGVVLMHMQGIPKTMQQNPTYEDVVTEVRRFFLERLEHAYAGGIQREQIILDPGFGFGKNLKHNLTLLANLDAFKELERPILVGVSRKGFVGHVIGRDVEHRLAGGAGAVATAVLLGARLIRTHDIPATKDVVTMVQAITGERNG